ncbi:MAG: M3 family metallopeptidase, partial [Gammaproteobacteria bacterium]
MINLKTYILISLLGTFLVACNTQTDELTTESISPLMLYSQEGTALSADKYKIYCTDTVTKANAVLDRLKTITNPSIDNFLKPLDQLWLNLSNIESETLLLRNAYPNLNIQRAAQNCNQAVTSIQSQINLSPEIYANLTDLSNAQQNTSTQKYIDDRIIHFQRNGADKPEADRKKIRQLFKEVEQLGSQYNDNVRRTEKSINILPKQLNGLPPDYIETHPVKTDNTVTITTNRTDMAPFMRYAESLQARIALYQAFASIGYPENIAVLKQLLAKRYELAHRLGYENWIDYTSSRSILNSDDQIQAFLDNTANAVRGKAKQEYVALLKKQQQKQAGATKVAPWNQNYLQDQIKQEQFHIDEKELRTYFAYNNVKEGIFALSKQLFSIDIEPWDTPVWHEDVEAYKVLENGEIMGYFYLDMHPRPDKYRNNQHIRLRLGIKDKQLPVSAIIANIPGGQQQIQLLEHIDTRSFLHEFGHLLHNIFSGKQEWFGFAGNLNIPDFVEVPSKTLKNWMWDGEVLKLFAKNEQGEVIPDDLIKQLQDSRDFGVNLKITRGLYLAALSLQLHRQDPE